jgi:hypothetical protein
VLVGTLQQYPKSERSDDDLCINYTSTILLQASDPIRLGKYCSAGR